MIGKPDAQQRSALAASLAPARLRPYRSVFGGDTNAGIDLYLLEMELVAAMQQIVAVVEVLMRERMHRSLTAAFGPEWYLSQRAVLDDRTRSQLNKATRHLGREPQPGKVVAEMEFGTWTCLLEAGGFIAQGTSSETRANYDRDLWWPALVHAFPHSGVATRSDIGLLARRARWARNRMAHRESVLFGFPQPGQRGASGRLIRQAPMSLLEDLRSLASYLDQDIGRWLRSSTSADLLLATDSAQAALNHSQRDPRNRRSWI